jgi:hypothetical protein
LRVQLPADRAKFTRMGRVLAILLVLALPVVAGEAPPGCAWLCGQWALDATQSDPAEAFIDDALQDYEEPDPDDRRPTSAQMRADLRAVLVPPAMLTLAEQGEEIIITATGQAERRLAVNRTQTRTDAAGTAEMRASWRSDDSLQVTDSHDRRRNHTETYALQRDGTLVITREVERPGVRRIRARSVYRRG